MSVGKNNNNILNKAQSKSGINYNSNLKNVNKKLNIDENWI